MSAGLPGGFSYRTAPTVSAVSPVNGPQGGGTWITVTGTGFARGVRATVGGVSCSELLLISSTQLGCYTPSRADSGGVAITVTNDDSQFGTGATFTYDQPPAVTNKMCANTASAELTGVLYDSGGASGNYINNNNQCEFRITAPPGKAITLSFSAFDLQEGGDFLQVFDGTNESGKPLHGGGLGFSGKTLPPVLRALSGNMYIIMRADEFIAAAGFAAWWYMTSPSAPTANFSWAGDINGSNPAPGERVQFTDLSGGSPTAWAWDFNEDGVTDSFSQNPSYLFSSTGTKRVSLIATNTAGSDRTTFSVDVSAYSISMTQVTSTRAAGTLYDSGGRFGPYSALSGGEGSFKFLISPGLGPISLTFSAFKTEPYYDWIKIYNGTDSSGELLHKLSGTILPEQIVANSGSMYIEMFTDGTVHYDGFEASWEAIPATAPETEFTFSPAFPLFPQVGEGVSFFDNSTNLISRSWDFDGNGLTDSAAPNPTFTYEAIGPKKVRLTGSNAAGSFIREKTVWVGANVMEDPGSSAMSDRSTGILFDSGGPYGGLSGSDKAFLIKPAAHATSITLTFQSMDLDSTQDALYVYKGENVSADYYGPFYGVVSPALITHTGSALYIYLDVNSGTSRSGFQATWTSTP